jgi:hypothetical protein
MYSHSVPLTPENIFLCAPLWGGRETYRDAELQEVLGMAAALLHERRAFGAVVVEEGHVRAFGMTTFAHERVIEPYLADPHPHIGKRLLLEARRLDQSSVLTIDAIAERNATCGGQLVVVNTGYDTSAFEPHVVLGRLIGAFLDTHRGYRIARIVNEVFGEAAISVVATSGTYEVLRVFDLLTLGETPLRSLVGALTRNQAAAWMNPLLAMFAYSPPRLLFTRAEQDVLAAALSGATDDTLSAKLQIPVSAVKARWSRIQERTARMAPDILRNVPIPSHHGRGVQTRHLILQYLREHPAELTPYPAPRLAREGSDVPQVGNRGCITLDSGQ